MADLTFGAVSSLLGMLQTAISDESQLIGGMQGDVQFIRDEMDSMNGFLLHLNKMETDHDDQIRAWMKQVRDIAYIAQDCIELYMRDLALPETGPMACLSRRVPLFLWSRKRRHLAEKIRELKVRVRDVGERRQRYDVKVPDANRKPVVVGHDSEADNNRENFLHALEAEAEEEKAGRMPTFSKAISLLPHNLPSEAETEIEAIRKKCESLTDPDRSRPMKMLLGALYAYPYGTKQEMKNLKEKLEANAADVQREVMVYCYSKLSTHYKSCLQYLTAFLAEESISRTCLVRRWVAEGLVARDDSFPTMEEAGELCFDELVFRGFIQPTPPVVTGLKIKSCEPLHGYIKKFVLDISGSENFVLGLPIHLHNQLSIRKNLQPLQRPPTVEPSSPKCRDSFSCCIAGKCSGVGDHDDDDDDKLHPMDKVLKTITSLREEYRLNVLDLGGCHGLKKRHLETIYSKASSIKYLSLRKTNITRLSRKINNLRLLETLDIRQTDVRATDTRNIIFPKMKHLLAGGHYPRGEKNQVVSLDDTVRMPRNIGRSTEILRHVKILHGEKELAEVARLKKLRKLGVVIDGSEENMKHLVRTITKLSESLHSLSVWITEPRQQRQRIDNAGAGVTFDKMDISDKKDRGEAAAAALQLKNLESLNIKCFRGKSTIGRLPSWIKELKKLSKVTLRDTLLTEEDLRILGQLESLRCLRLRHGSYVADKITLQNGEFQKLKLLQLVDHVYTGIDIDNATTIVLEEGAAPNLEKISWNFDWMVIRSNTISGISKHQSLREIELLGNCDGQQKDQVEEALGLSPNGRPLLKLPDIGMHDASITADKNS